MVRNITHNERCVNSKNKCSRCETPNEVSTVFCFIDNSFYGLSHLCINCAFIYEMEVG